MVERGWVRGVLNSYYGVEQSFFEEDM